jgi:hypothetical protein
MSDSQQRTSQVNRTVRLQPVGQRPPMPRPPKVSELESGRLKHHRHPRWRKNHSTVTDRDGDV